MEAGKRRPRGGAKVKDCCRRKSVENAQACWLETNRKWVIRQAPIITRMSPIIMWVIITIMILAIRRGEAWGAWGRRTTHPCRALLPTAGFATPQSCRRPTALSCFADADHGLQDCSLLKRIREPPQALTTWHTPCDYSFWEFRAWIRCLINSSFSINYTSS